MPVDEQILVTGTSGLPLSYTVPNSIEAALLCVNATIDGSGASGAFLATVEIVSDGGVVVARCPCFTTIAAGGSAEISWFRLRDTQAVTSSGLTPYEALITSIGGLVLYWKLDDAFGSGTTADQLGVNTGTVFGSVTQGVPKLADVLAAQYVAGMSGIKSTLAVDLSTQLMSCVCWVKTTAAAAASAIAWSDTNAPQGRWFFIETNAAGDIVPTIFTNGGNAVQWGAAGPLNDGVTHCVGFTYGATTPSTGAGAVGKIYLDGVLLGSTPLNMLGSGLTNSARMMMLGAKWRNALDDPAGIEQLVGTIDEFAVWNTTLTDAHMAAINAAGRIV